MLTYAQEIDDKLQNSKESRNKYYQICQQLTSKYSKLKKKYEHLYLRYQSYKGRNKELFALLQYLSSEDIRVQHQILKYQSKYKQSVQPNQSQQQLPQNEHSHSVSEQQPQPQQHSDTPNEKTHSKSKTATTLPFRRSILCPQSASMNEKYNPFCAMFNNSYKRNSKCSRSQSVSNDSEGKETKTKPPKVKKKKSKSMKHKKVQKKRSIHYNNVNSMMVNPSSASDDEEVQVLNNQPSHSSIGQHTNDHKIEYSRSHCSSLALSENDSFYGSDNEHTKTQKIYYEKLKLTPVPQNKRSVDKNRLIKVLQSLPTDNGTNSDPMCLENDDFFAEIENYKKKKSHFRSSSQSDYSSVDSVVPILSANSSENSKNIKLFYRFEAKSYPPMIAKTTNTIKQLQSNIASSLKLDNSDCIQLYHRGIMLKNTNLTLSQCDIDQYDTIIAKKREEKSPKSAADTQRIKSSKIGIIGQFTPYKQYASTGSMITCHNTPRRSLLGNNNANGNEFEVLNADSPKNMASIFNKKYGVSRPCSIRGFDDGNSPFSVCPQSITVSSPKYKANKLRVRFTNDQKMKNNANESNNCSLELRRNLSRSLDTGIDENKQQNNALNNYQSKVNAYSPMPSRRRTHKLESPPLSKLMDTTNCKKSKSLFVRNKASSNNNKNSKGCVNRLFKINECALTMKMTDDDDDQKGGENMDDIDAQMIDLPPPVPTAFKQRSQSRKKIKTNHISSSSLASDLSVNVSLNDSMDTLEDESDEDVDDALHLELERNVSREDLMSGSDLSVEEYPKNFEDRARRKTVEINNKTPLKHFNENDEIV